MIGALLAAESIDVSRHLPLATDLALWGFGLLIAFFLVRPELWWKLWFDRIDPRPSALMRIFFGFVVLLTFTDLLFPNNPLEYSVARFLFTDDGLWLTDLARKSYGGELTKLWDPEHGFEHWYDIFKAMWGKFSILHFRSDPPFVFTLYGIMLASLVSMIVGWQTRIASIVAFVLVETFYRYSPIFYSGGDTVVRVFLFLGMFSGWGNAYSIDSWRRRRKAVLAGAKAFPPLRRIAAWPIRLMMLQLCCIYFATGLLKTGDLWANGEALYYALNLDHFYRVPAQGPVTIAHYLGFLPANAIVVRWWEVFFPLVAIGAAINAYERDRANGTWPQAALWRRALSYLVLWGAWGMGAYILGIATLYYFPPEKFLSGLPMASRMGTVFWSVLFVPPIAMAVYVALRRFGRPVFDFVRFFFIGKRFWLVFGVGVHIGIDVGMNVGTFAEVMMAVYFAWLSGSEIDAFWRYVYSQPCAPGEGERPIYKQRWRGAIAAPFERLFYRKPGKPYVVLHHPGDAGIRRASLLRIWDLGGRLEFRADADIAPETLAVEHEGKTVTGNAAAAILIPAFAAFIPLRPLRFVPGVGWFARVILTRG